MNGTSTDDEIQKAANDIEQKRKQDKIVALRDAEAALLEEESDDAS